MRFFTSDILNYSGIIWNSVGLLYKQSETAGYFEERKAFKTIETS